MVLCYRKLCSHAEEGTKGINCVQKFLLLLKRTLWIHKSVTVYAKSQKEKAN